MSDEQKSPEEPEVEAHGQPWEAPEVEAPSYEANEDEEPDVEAHGQPFEVPSVEAPSFE